MMQAGSKPSDATFGQRMIWGNDVGAFDNKLGEILTRLWHHGVYDGVVDQLLDDVLRPYEKLEALGQLEPFKASRFNEGNLRLGKDTRGRVIQLVADWLSSGTLVVANTGGGKTTLLSFLVLQLAALRCPVWLSENYKVYLRHLRPLFRQMGTDPVIVGARDWRWNPLQSFLDNPNTQRTAAVDLLIRLLELPSRARAMLNQGLDDLYRRFGNHMGNRAEWPTLIDLFEWVRTRPGLNPQARDAIMDRLGSLIISVTPGCIAYRSGWNPAQLAEFSIVFEMKGTSETAKQLLLGSLLRAVFDKEVERGLFNGPLRLVIAFDDSQRFFDAGGQGGFGELAPMDELAGVIRGTGIGLILLVQTMAGLSPRLLPNLGIKIMGRLGAAADYDQLGADMGLSLQQKAWAKLHLQPPLFIGQTAHGWREPFAFRAPLIQLPAAVSASEAAESLAPLNEMPTVFAEEFRNWTPDYSLGLSSKVGGNQPRGRSSSLDEASIRFLRAVMQNPGRPSSAYARLARLGTKQAVGIRNRLVQAGFLRECPVATSLRGRQSILLELLPSAYAVVAETGGAL